MQVVRTARVDGRDGLRAATVLLVLLLLLIATLAATPSLHITIHPDANQATHQCAITLFAHGQVDTATADVIVIAPTPLCIAVVSTPISIPSTTIENLPPGRAPPVSVSSQV